MIQNIMIWRIIYIILSLPRLIYYTYVLCIMIQIHLINHLDIHLIHIYGIYKSYAITVYCYLLRIHITFSVMSFAKYHVLLKVNSKVNYFQDDKSDIIFWLYNIIENQCKGILYMPEQFCGSIRQTFSLYLAWTMISQCAV